MAHDPNHGRVRSFSFSRGPGGTTIVNEGAFSLSVKATSALSLLAIWVTMIPAIAVEPGAWPALIFAFLGTIAIGVSAWRRLGFSRLLAITGIWFATALAIVGDSGNWWMSVFAFLATGAVVYSIMKRTDIIGGVAVAIAWLVTGIVAMTADGGATWIAVFAFLSTAAIANAFTGNTRAIVAIAAWSLAGALMLALDGSYWLAVIAALASMTSLGLGGFSLPRRFEWDLFERDATEHNTTPR